MSNPRNSLSLKRALALMSGVAKPRRRSLLVKMHTPSVPNGYAWYVLPGGYVSPETAASLIKRPDIKPGNDGLLPGHDQTWRMV
jgi:hypothetical protein